MRNLKAWARSAIAARADGHLQALCAHLMFRARWQTIGRFGDLPLAQLRSVERAFRRDPAPELLIFGDFAMDWVTPGDADYRHLPDMIQDAIGRPVSCEFVVGSMYNARILMAYLSAVAAAPQKPRVIVVPLSTATAQSLWLAHPTRGFVATAAHLRESVGAGGTWRSPRAHPTADELAAWDDIPLGADGSTAGRAQLIASSTPRTPAQHEVWARNLMTLYHGERLRPDSPGVLLAGELATALRELRVPSFAVIPPVHCEALEAALGADAVEAVKANADLLRMSFLNSVAGSGEVVDLTCASGPAHFADPLHLNADGRHALATAVSGWVEKHLASDSNDA